MKLIPFLFLFVFSISIVAKKTKIDSLKVILDQQNAKDTLQLNALLDLAKACIDEKIVDGYDYAIHASNLAQELNDKDDYAYSLRVISSYFEKVKNNYDSAISYLKNANTIYQAIESEKGKAITNYNIASNYTYKKDYTNAADYFLKSYYNYLHTDDTESQMDAIAQAATMNYYISEFDKAIEYNEIGIELSKKQGTKRREANFYNGIAAVYKRKGNLPRALEYFNQGLALCQEIDDKEIIAYTSNNLANVYADYGDYIKAIEYYLLALNSCEEVGNKGCMAAAYNNIAIVYYTQKDYPKTLDYLFKSLVAYQEYEEFDGIANTLNNIAELYMMQDSLEKSLDYYNQSFPIITELKNRYLLYYNYSGKAAVYDKMKKFDVARDLHFKGLATAKEIQALYEIAHSYKGISHHFLLTEQYKLAQLYADSALNFGESYGVPEIIKDAAEILHQSYAKMKNFRKAYQYHLLYTEMNDSILNDNNTKKVTQLEMQYKHEKELKEREIEQAKKDLIKEKELNRQKGLRNTFLGAFAFVLILVFVVLRNYREKKKANELLSKQKAEIEEKNEELNQLNNEISRQKDELEKNHKKITDSIKYAEKIQTALLPSNDVLQELVPKHFILYKPRDIVSGDFYWVRKVDDLVLIAVADCTGHGVPGAMMSMLGISFLNDISRRKEVDKPSKILAEMRNQVKTSLKQTGKRDEARDGMDMAFIEINRKENSLCFAGANNPLIIIRDGELMQYKADRQPISIYFKEKEFTDHKIKLEKGDRIYMFSDGFMDQINMDDRKKFSSFGLRKKLEEVHLKPMPEQKEILENVINSWMGDPTNQVDDILIMGIEI